MWRQTHGALDLVHSLSVVGVGVERSLKQSCVLYLVFVEVSPPLLSGEYNATSSRVRLWGQASLLLTTTVERAEGYCKASTRLLRTVTWYAIQSEPSPRMTVPTCNQDLRALHTAYYPLCSPMKAASC